MRDAYVQLADLQLLDLSGVHSDSRECRKEMVDVKLWTFIFFYSGSVSDFITVCCSWAVGTDLIKRVTILLPLTTNGSAFCDQYACDESKIM